MHSFLILGSYQESLPQISQISPIPIDRPSPDVHIIAPEKLGINEIRELIQLAGKKPFIENFIVFIVKNADKMTIEAQNALLKTLEEPPPQVTIILQALNREALLPTIISRCALINAAASNPDSSPEIERLSLSRLSLLERLDLAQNHAYPREKAINFSTNLVMKFREELAIQPQDPKKLANLEMALKTLKRLKQNCESRLCLENLFLNLE